AAHRWLPLVRAQLLPTLSARCPLSRNDRYLHKPYRLPLHHPTGTKLLFLPGAGASARFWRPVADRLGQERKMHFFSWPGLGHEPVEPCMQGLDDAVAMVLARMTEPVDLLAQSMGGLIALKAA